MGVLSRKIFVFGGTFDPLTPAHCAIAYSAVKSGMCDEFVFAPSIVTWYRKDKPAWLSMPSKEYLIEESMKKMRSIGNRISIYKDDNSMMELMPFDYREKFAAGWHFINTLEHIAIKYSAFDVSLNVVVGSDQLAFFKNWHRWEDILSLANLVAVEGRSGVSTGHEAGIYHTPLRIPEEYLSISATNIRARYSGLNNGYVLYNNYLTKEIEKLELKNDECWKQ